MFYSQFTSDLLGPNYSSYRHRTGLFNFDILICTDHYWLWQQMKGIYGNIERIILSFVLQIKFQIYTFNMP